MSDRFRPDAAVRRVSPRAVCKTPIVAPSSSTFASETNKDRSGKHGSEVA
jgi:hypothetical protein